MFKRIACTALSVVFFIGILPRQVIAAGSSSEEVDAAAVVHPAEQEDTLLPAGPVLYVDNQVLEDAELFYYNGYAYASLRAVTIALHPNASLTWSNGKANISDSDLQITVDPKKDYIVANERCLYAPNGVLCQNNSIFVSVRILAKIFNAKFIHNIVTSDIYLTSGNGSILSGSEFYNQDDLYWLSHIIHAESGNQSLEGKIAVGNVILNRVADPTFPNTIYEVIFQKNQFTPTKNGTINLIPNEESIVAAKLCLEGVVVLPTALFFNTVNSKSWAAAHKSYVATIGSHAFYA